MTCDQFLELLGQYGASYIAETDLSLPSLKRYGREHGWLEEQDVISGSFPIEKRALARILHQFLRLELGEKEKPGWEEAMELKDLLDCRSCVNHVAQMYIKGIMRAKSDEQAGLVFGMRDVVSKEEGEEILERAFHRSHPTEKQEDLQKENSNKADTRKDNAQRSRQERPLTVREAADKMKQRPGILVDVRDVRAFEEWHLKEAVNIPLSVILSDPKVIVVANAQPIYFYCEEGVKSQIAAEYLREHGYQETYFIRAEKEK